MFASRQNRPFDDSALEKRSLATILRAHGRIPVVDAVDIALDICDALASAHAHGVVHRDVKPGKKLKVAWDVGNGAVGVSIRAVVDKLPGEHFVLNEKVDGTFPAHHPDPTVPKNLEQLIAEVAKQKAHVGFARPQQIEVVDAAGGGHHRDGDARMTCAQALGEDFANGEVQTTAITRGQPDGACRIARQTTGDQRRRGCDERASVQRHDALAGRW